MKGSQMVIAALEQEKVEVVFGYPGGAVLPLYDALYHSSLRHILTRHEQGATHAADGFARASGKPGVVIATSGPGATNLVTGIATAQMDSVPMVIVTGQVATRLIGTDAFQEADITGITLPITKHNYLVKRAADLPEMFSEAFHIATTGRCGPVLIDIPKDVFDQEANFSYQPSPEIAGYKPTYEGHQGQVSRAAKAIAAARKPVVFAGGGVLRSGACVQLRELAEKGQLPVILSLMGLGAFPGSSELFLGMAGMHGTVAANYALMEADLILAAGVRFDDRVTGKLEKFAPRAKIIHIDIDPAEIGKNVAVDIPIVGDLKRVLASLLSRLQPQDTSDWRRQVQEWRSRYPLTYREGLHESVVKPQYIIKEIYRLTGGEAIITTDVGQHQMWVAQEYQFCLPRTLLTSGGLG
ncbi:MAG TPA: biosynthetic-type acetolactate synthase large subunit, partial [Firmicutes bacterium]|nr:biosynthetic-type acetolactate synthase large subunit [Bacillota bacterium]